MTDLTPTATAISSEIGYLNACWEKAQAKQRKLEADLAHWATLSPEAMIELEAHLINAHFDQMYDAVKTMTAAGSLQSPRTLEQERWHCMCAAEVHVNMLLDPDYTEKRNAAIWAAINEDA